MMRFKAGFFAALAVQFILLSSVIAFKQFTIWTGETVVLRVEPLDPRDLFRGDYVRLRFAISRIDPAAVGGDDDIGYDSIWVELVPGEDGIWQPAAIWRRRPTLADGHVAIKGDIIGVPYSTSPFVEVEYGVEDVFIPAGAGRTIETATGTVTLETKVDLFGRAIARRILIDGRPFEVKER